MAQELNITLRRNNGTDLDVLHPTTTWAQVEDKPSSFAPTAHSHGNITDDGKIGTTSDRVVTTTTGGLLTTLSRSGIDSRASFPPSSHTHDDRYFTETEADARFLGISAKAADSDKLDGQDWVYVHSRGQNLFTNGAGLLGNNTNMSSFTFDGSEANYSAGSFRRYSSATLYSDEMMPVDVNKKYRMSIDAKSLNGIGRYYMMTVCFDVDNNSIDANNHMYRANTLTTLAQPLNNGDTVVYLTDASNWDNSGTAGVNTHLRSIITWDYTNSFGYTYPPETYSRNWLGNAWDPGAIDFVNNTITLRVPWAGGNKPAGTPLSNGSSGGSYKYNVMSSVVIPTTWTHYEGIMDGVDLSGTNVSTKFPPGTAKIKMGWLMNYQGSGETVWFTNIKVTEDYYSPNNKPTASDVGLGNVDNTSDANKPVSTAQQTALNNKVDKVTGKGLSTNDYTTDEKNKLAGIASGAEVNVQSDWNQATTTADDYIKNKPTIPSKVSDLTNDTGYITSDTETDPVFTAWDKSTGISITESQISDLGNYAPKSHAYTTDTFGLGTTEVYGHVKTVNGLTQNSHVDGYALSAYQGYLLNTNKAPNSHASTATTYGAGSTVFYGHVKTINDLTKSSYVSGDALSAYQGYVLNNAIAGKADSGHTHDYAPTTHTHDVDEIEPVLSTVTASTYSNNLKPNSTVVFDSTSGLICYLDNIADTGTYQNQWQIGDTLTVIRKGTGYVRIYDSAGTLYVNNEGTPAVGGYIYLPRFTAVTCIMIGGTTSATDWIILGATSTSSTI